MTVPVVAIVGRPNVGKSTLFNKLVGKRVSIVDNVSGVTRDRIYGECSWRNRRFSLIDTGGIEPYTKDVMFTQMREQVQIAIEASDVVVFVTDVRTGIVSTDKEIALSLKKSNKNVILCVNKCDSIGELEQGVYEFYNLGLGDPIAISSVHGHGTGDLLDEILKYFPDESNELSKEEIINVAVIGKPNVGKSSLVNKITGENRCIVSDVAGTTRDFIDVNIKNRYGNFKFVDTAGIRKKSKINDKIEKYSIMRAEMAIRDADVCVIMIDAKEGATEQDTKIAGIACKSDKACIIAVNKWDVIKKQSYTLQETKKRLQINFAFMPYAYIAFISVKTGKGIEQLFKLITESYNSYNRRVSTGVLNDLMSRALLQVQPPTKKGKRLKIYYITQVSVKPPTFVFFVNEPKLFHFSYQRYLENSIRETFDFKGTPIRLIIKKREDRRSTYVIKNVDISD